MATCYAQDAVRHDSMDAPEDVANHYHLQGPSDVPDVAAHLQHTPARYTQKIEVLERAGAMPRTANTHLRCGPPSAGLQSAFLTCKLMHQCGSSLLDNAHQSHSIPGLMQLQLQFSHGELPVSKQTIFEP